MDDLGTIAGRKRNRVARHIVNWALRNVADDEYRAIITVLIKYGLDSFAEDARLNRPQARPWDGVDTDLPL